MTSSLEKNYSIKTALPWQQMGTQVIILDSDHSRAHELNGTASLLWPALAKGPVSVRQLAHILATNYNIDEVRATTDTEKFLARLEAQGLIQCQ
jgi:hypothetical protein